MPTPTQTMTSERADQDDSQEHHDDRRDDLRQLMLNVFSLQEKVAQVAQLAMALSTQAAKLSATASVTTFQSEPQGDIPLPRAPRGTPPPLTVVDGDGAMPALAPRRRVRRRPESPTLARGTQTVVPKNTPPSSIELALTKKPMTPKQLAAATGQSLATTNEVLKVLEEDKKVHNIGFSDHPIYVWRIGDGVGDNVTNDEVQAAIEKYLTSRWLPIRTLVAAIGVRIQRVDGVMTKLKRAGRLDVKKEGERGRALVYTMKAKPDPKHPYLKSNKPPKSKTPKGN